ncbi:potassium channel family protein [Candidatus Epulonipiscium viviparus]|uniref:potassium channel family protein n=1 Tax=Candidatus Epulonipiscium viviparus TaxID=420336 RepID=UPI00016C061A|nr:TrkA family potassium uptake protein [Candidatus Epulopiscium viviparus]
MKRKQFVVCGLGKFGTSLATALANSGYEVLAIDRDEDRVQELSNIATHTIQADTTDMEAVRALGIKEFDVGVVAIGNDIQSSVMTTLILKELGIKYVMAKATNAIHEKVLKKIGADRVIQPELDMGRRVATTLISGSIIEHIQLSADYSIAEVPVLVEWVGNSIIDVNLRSKYGINVIAIQGKGRLDISPRPDYIFNKDDVLVVVGANEKIKALNK